MDALDRAKLSLQGLAAGDAFGQRLFGVRMNSFITSKKLPEGQWRWTDDTAMAISIVEILRDYGEIEQDRLAAAFAERYQQDRYRGYGSGAHYILQKIYEGGDWRKLAPSLFNGGSYGNGAAMRIAPLGGYFADDPEHARTEAVKSAVITHAHDEARAGAIAVAVAASIAATQKNIKGNDFIGLIESFIPESEVKTKIRLSQTIDPAETVVAAKTLGTGQNISSQDTVPFCIWCASNHLDNYEEALWQTVSGFGDQDTTCAMVGGIVSLSSGGVPEKIQKHVESLPSL